MSPSGGASPDQPDESGKRYLSVSDQPSSMVVVRSISLEIGPQWQIMFVEYVVARIPKELVSEITMGHGYAYVTSSGYGEQAKENKREILKLINDIIVLITPDTLALWVSQRDAKPAHA